MNAAERRKRITDILGSSQGPVSAGALANELGVSRQIVVGDIALLRAGGMQIDATPRGYVGETKQNTVSLLVPCVHDGGEGMREELYTVVDNGGMVENVIIENPLYGEIIGRLHLSSRYDVDVFVKKACDQPESLLSYSTGGVHLHTIICPDRETADRILAQLKEKGILYTPGADK